MSRIRKLYLVDWENTICYPDKPILEMWGWDLLNKSSLPQKIYLSSVAPLLYLIKSEEKNKEYKEIKLLNAFDRFVLLIKPKYKDFEETIERFHNFVIEEAEEFLKEISKQKNNKICIISTGATEEVLKDFLKQKKIESVEVYANKFQLYNDTIVSFEKPIISDRKGKFEKSIEIIKKYSPKRIIGSGDSYSDIGIAQVSDFFYTHKNADLDLREYVERKFGKEFIYNSPKDMFEDLKNLI